MIRKTLPFLATTAILVLSSACAGNRTMGERLDDGVISSKIEAKMAADPEVSAFNVDVDTENGMVRLSGMVESENARQEAEKLARNTEGVRSVDNDITIGKETLGDRLDDAAVTAKVKAKLAADPEVKAYKIDVDTNDHVVTLSGTVAEADARQEAEQLAKSVDGVKDVRNLLKIAAN